MSIEDFVKEIVKNMVLLALMFQLLQRIRHGLDRRQKAFEPVAKYGIPVAAIRLEQGEGYTELVVVDFKRIEYVAFNCFVFGLGINSQSAQKYYAKFRVVSEATVFDFSAFRKILPEKFTGSLPVRK